MTHFFVNCEYRSYTWAWEEIGHGGFYHSSNVACDAIGIILRLYIQTKA